VTSWFRSLRRRRPFCRAVRGGVFNLEAEWGTEGWLVHIHAVLDLEHRLAREYVKEVWTDLGGGYNLDLKDVTKGTELRTFAYGTKRAFLLLDPGLVREYFRAMHGVLCAGAWGTQHHLFGRSPSRRTRRTETGKSGSELAS